MLPSEAFFVFTARTLIKVYSEKVKQLIYLNKKAPYKELLYPEQMKYRPFNGFHEKLSGFTLISS